MNEDEEALKELREIRKLLERPPAQPAPEGIMAEFIDFLSKFRVIGLAAGFILSLYLGGLVKSFVDGFVMPIIGLILPSGNWESATMWIFKPGMFLSALITFLIVCLVVFLMVKAAKRWGLE
jgi:large conductance mechanosensitive channel